MKIESEISLKSHYTFDLYIMYSARVGLTSKPIGSQWRRAPREESIGTSAGNLIINACRASPRRCRPAHAAIYGQISRSVFRDDAWDGSGKGELVFFKP